MTRTRVLERQQQDGFPGTVNYALGPAGDDLVAVARALQGWLSSAPGGPIPLGSTAAKGLIKALVQGWSCSIVRALASRPLSLTELSRLIAGLNYPSLERRLGALRAAGLIEPCPGQARSTPYRVTTWLRRAIVPLAVGARWERRHAPEETTPIGRIDVEAAFLLTLPMLELPTDVTGGCRLAVETRSGGIGMTGVTARFAEGRIESCVARLEGAADAGACGTAMAWIDAIEGADPERLEIRGDHDLASGILEGLHDTLLATPRSAQAVGADTLIP